MTQLNYVYFDYIIYMHNRIIIHIHIYTYIYTCTTPVLRIWLKPHIFVLVIILNYPRLIFVASPQES